MASWQTPDCRSDQPPHPIPAQGRARWSTPMTDRYLHHVTLTTGDSRRSYRSEVSREAVDLCSELLDDAIAQPKIHTVIPRVRPQCTMTATAEGRALIVTIWGPPTELRGSAPVRPPLVTMGVGVHSRSGAKLWSLLHSGREAELATDPDECPPEPWVGVRMEVGVALTPEATEWLGDLERCLGWAWVEADERRRERTS